MKREWYIFGALVILNAVLIAVLLGGRKPATPPSSSASGAPVVTASSSATGLPVLGADKFNPRHSAAMLPLVGYIPLTPRLIDVYKKMLAISPASADYRALLGEALLVMGQTAQASEVLEAVRNDDPQCSLALCFEGDLALAKNDVTAAVSHYEQAAAAAKCGFDRALAYRRLGVMKMWQNDLKAADAAFEAALKAASEEKGPDAALVRILILTDQSLRAQAGGDLARAIALLDEAARLADTLITPESARRFSYFDDRPLLQRIARAAWLRLARCARDAGDLPRARKVVEARIEVDGDAFTLSHFLVDLLLAEGKTKEAQRVAIPLYARRLSVENVVTIFRKTGVAPSAPVAGVSPVGARSSFPTGSPSAGPLAESMPTPKLAPLRPSNVPNRGEDDSFQSYSETQAKVSQYMMRERYDEGIRYCNRILENEPMRAQVRGLLATLLEAQGDLEGARQQAEQANAVVETPAAMHALGMLALRQGDLHKAYELFEKENTVGEASSGEMVPGGISGLVYTRLWMTGPQAAADELKKRLSGTAETMGAHLSLQAALDLLQGNKDAAVEKARRLTTLRPEDIGAFALLANVLELAGRPKEALAALEDAPDPTDPGSVQRLLLARVRLLAATPQAATAISEGAYAQIAYPGMVLTGVELWKARYAPRK